MEGFPQVHPEPHSWSSSMKPAWLMAQEGQSWGAQLPCRSPSRGAGGGRRGWGLSPGPPVTHTALQLARLETQAYVFLTTLYTGSCVWGFWEGILSVLESWLRESNTTEV